MADTEKLVEQLSGLSVLEIAGLVKQLEEKWGVSAAAPVAVAAGPTAGGPAGAAAPAAEEKTIRLNQAAIEAGLQTCGREVITLSVGTVFCPEDGYDVEALLAEADRPMYSVKQVHHAQAAATTRDILAQGASGK